MERLSPAQAVRRLADRLRGTGGRVFIPGGPAEPLALADAWRCDPETAAGLTFLGAWFPGVNRTDWSGLHPGARAETTFVGPDGRAAFETGRARFRPLSYTQTAAWLESTPLDAVVAHLSPPDAAGFCSFGVACDFAPALLERPLLKLALVNPAMPAAVNGPRIPLAAFDLIAEAEHPLVTYDAGAFDPATLRLAEQVVARVPDGATVEVGLGKAGVAALVALRGRRGLRVHSGMVTEPLLDLLDAGVVEAATTGVALGSPELYARLAADRRIRFAPVSVTHDPRVLGAIPRFTAINSALEVDLFGQANAEFVAGRQVSGVGGLVDFLRGAALSVGGAPILALNATARGGAVSRIVPHLPQGAVSVARADVAVVVTEHGSADLRDLDLDARAEALITLAASAWRDTLAEAWAAMRRRM